MTHHEPGRHRLPDTDPKWPAYLMLAAFLAIVLVFIGALL